MATMSQMRQFCLDAYPNATMKWREHIATTRNTRQIVAIYKKLKDDPKKLKEVTDEYHQMDLFEWQVANQKAGTHTEVKLDTTE